MKISAVIIGYGSIAKKHLDCLKKINQINCVYIYSKRNISYKYSLKSLNDILLVDPKYIIIASNTADHYQDLKFLINNFQKKIILVEKPLFNKYKYLNLKNNIVYVGYNLRFHPILLFLKKELKNKKIFSVDVINESYLPKWRNNRKYTHSYSAIKKLGGGVLLDLSHELDYLFWLFGLIKPKFIYNTKLSNLNINSDDFLLLHAVTKKKTIINLSLNYYSRIPIRQISIKGDNFSIFADLILNKIIMVIKNKKKEISFKKFNILDTYYDLHNNILSKKTQNVCSFKEGLKTMKLIDTIRDK